MWIGIGHRGGAWTLADRTGARKIQEEGGNRVPTEERQPLRFSFASKRSKGRDLQRQVRKDLSREEATYPQL